MEYTISQLAKLAGISTRTLRYYDEINLLKPKRINSSGYRIYSQEEVDRLQQILFFRELDVNIETILSIMNDPNFDSIKALEHHLTQLMKKRSRLDNLIESVKKTIAHEKGVIVMNNEEKFKAFKEQLIEENEQQYGKEIREKYGDDIIDKSNNKLRNLSKGDFERFRQLEVEILELLEKAVQTGDPSSPPARELAAKHKEWLTLSWPEYSEEAHRGLAEMYVSDERFKAYYDRKGPGATEFLRDAILRYLENK